MKAVHATEVRPMRRAENQSADLMGIICEKTTKYLGFSRLKCLVSSLFSSNAVKTPGSPPGSARSPDLPLSSLAGMLGAGLSGRLGRFNICDGGTKIEDVEGFYTNKPYCFSENGHSLNAKAIISYFLLAYRDNDNEGGWVHPKLDAARHPELKNWRQCLRGDFLRFKREQLEPEVKAGKNGRVVYTGRWRIKRDYMA